MRVTAVDVSGNPLRVGHVITCKKKGSSRLAKVADVPAGGAAEFETVPTSFYFVRVVADGYAGAAVSVSGTTRNLPLPVPVSSSAVVGYRWPDPWPDIPGVTTLGPSSDGERRALVVEGDTERAALLNIWAKLWEVGIGITPAATYIEEVIEVRADRIIARVAPELPEILAESVFDVVPSGLHEPPEGYVHGISIKTDDHYGNLQITTFVNDAGDVLADIDIDENRGVFAHLFDVAQHHISGDKTDPVEIHQLLVHQGIEPGWWPLLA